MDKTSIVGLVTGGTPQDTPKIPPKIPPKTWRKVDIKA